MLKLYLWVGLFFLIHSISYDTSNPSLGEFSIEHILSSAGKVQIDMGEFVYPVYNYNITVEPSDAMCFVAKQPLKKKAHTYYKINQSEFICATEHQDQLYALLMDGRLMHWEITSTGELELIHTYTFKEGVNFPKLSSIQLIHTTQLYLFYDEKLFSIRISEGQWEINFPQLIAQVLEIRANDETIYGLHTNKISQVINGKIKSIVLSDTHRYKALGFSNGSLYISELESNSIIKYDVQNQTQSSYEVEDLEDVQELYVKGSFILMKLIRNNRQYLWELEIVADTIHSNKIYYRYSQFNIVNVLLYENKMAILQTQDLLIYFQYGVNRGVDSQTVLNSEIMRVLNYNGMVGLVQLPRSVDYMILFSQTIFHYILNPSNILSYKYSCSVDSRKPYEQWPSRISINSQGLCKEAEQDYCHEQVVYKIDYGDKGGHYGINNSHLRFMGFWLLAMLILSILVLICWRMLLRKASQLKKLSEERTKSQELPSMNVSRQKNPQE